LESRFFSRFHPVKAFKNWRHVWGARARYSDNVTVEILVHDYVFEMAMLLHPKTGNGKFIDNLCQEISVTEAQVDELPSPRKDDIGGLKRHFAKHLKKAIWKQIHSLAMKPAGNVFQKLQASQDGDSCEGYDSPQPKRARKINMFEMAGLSSPESTATGHSPGSGVALPNSPADVVDREIEFYKQAIMEQAVRAIDSDSAGLSWWDAHKDRMPCLRQVAKTIYGMLPGSGALELDIGAFKDIISPKRGSLGPGLVEVQMMLRINKDITTLDTTKVSKIGKHWTQHMPKRPDFPGGYFEESEDEGDGSGP
jgi:hypothetical protein